jgi:cytidyltransferase-like protein
MKVFVSGSFDLLHSGHVEFFEEASRYGDLYVGIGSDESIKYLKNRLTVCFEDERLYMVKAIRYVKDANINSGMGLEDFTYNPFFIFCDILIVNEDQDSEAKKLLCDRSGKQYIVLKRLPHECLPARSSTEMRKYGKRDI